jgi:PhnB protein
MPVEPVPKGYHTVTPYLLVREAAKLIEFLEKTFEAQVVERHARPDGTVMHAQVRVGDSLIMLGDPREPWTPMPTTLYVYLKDVDAAYGRALHAGGVSVMDLTNHFYGDRMGGVKDPFGNIWWIATHVEDVSPEEMKRRTAELYKKQ